MWKADNIYPSNYFHHCFSSYTLTLLNPFPTTNKCFLPILTLAYFLYISLDILLSDLAWNLILLVYPGTSSQTTLTIALSGHLAQLHLCLPQTWRAPNSKLCKLYPFLKSRKIQENRFISLHTTLTLTHAYGSLAHSYRHSHTRKQLVSHSIDWGTLSHSFRV